jgi:glycosyltransferase involved in cell wall biosynthesis
MTPRILCVMLASGRQEMVDRAVRSFYSQTYLDKRLLVFDTGDEPLRLPPHGREISYVRASPPTRRLSIGALRNAANEQAGSHGAKVVAHWDSDDWSHPERLADQLALLEATGVEAVGYRELPFWDTSIEGLKRDYPAGPVVWTVPPEGWKGGVDVALQLPESDVLHRHLAFLLAARMGEKGVRRSSGSRGSPLAEQGQEQRLQLAQDVSAGDGPR